MEHFNKEQQEAIDSIYGPVLILAGAGSGKTKVLTHKIAKLLNENYAKPEEILAVTFTNKAADEMICRIIKIIRPEIDVSSLSTFRKRTFLPWMGTFHSVCLKILRSDGESIGISSNITIYDTNEQLDVVKSIFKKLNLNDKNFKPKGFLAQISAAKNNLIDTETFAAINTTFPKNKVALVYKEYQKILQNNSALDFDDLLMKTVELFNKDQKVLEKYQNLFKFILVDEYQDTNDAQYRILEKLAFKHKNICIVGDDAQAIYGFRGANINNILNFEKHFPNSKVIKFEQNYRSTKTILNASNDVISLNVHQKKKTLWTENAEGEKIRVYEAKNERDERAGVVKKIRELLNDGVNPNEVAVLYRTNAQSRAIEEALLNFAINYRIVGGLKFYSRKEIKDVIAYLRIIFNNDDEVSLKRIINVPKRNIGPKKIENLENLAREKKCSILKFLLNTTKEEELLLDKNIVMFKELIQSLIGASKELNIVPLIKKVLEDSNYLDLYKEETTENETRLENIKELLSVAKNYEEYDVSSSLETFLNEISLFTDTESDAISNSNSITLMTIHAAKGLEFEHVFIVGMEEGLFPHSRSYDDLSEMEEERRLAYVAITRAKKCLYLSYAESRLYFGTINSNMVSRFLTDISSDLITLEDDSSMPSGWSKVEESVDFSDDVGSKNIKLNIGDMVKHPIFGAGMVDDVSDDTVVVIFSGGVKKELALEYVQLEKLNP